MKPCPNCYTGPESFLGTDIGPMPQESFPNETRQRWAMECFDCEGVQEGIFWSAKEALDEWEKEQILKEAP